MAAPCQQEFAMANKMIIDASHPEETRVVVLRGNRVEEFDFESASKKQLRGNIYLAKVTRVEPSLQAAFVEYGGNRHGFLAFSEIHPDYYQIPHADRAALLEEEYRSHREEEEEDGPRRRSRRNRRGAEKRRAGDDERVNGELPAEEERAAAEEAPQNGEEAAAEENATEEILVAETEWGAPPAEAGESAAESGQEETAVAEAPKEVAAPAPQVESHELAFDPEGFAVVEEGAPEDDEDAPVEAEARAPEQAVVGEAESEAEAAPPAAEAESDEEETGGPSAEAKAKTGEAQENGENDESGENGEAEEEESVEQLGGDAMDEAPYRAPRLRRQYKIQEVIKRRQVLLIQVVKEERGNKGAAVTTYLSLAGRYSVLMPNTARGGGISRKITDTGDRKRLKDIAQELDVPEGMGVILRTAGAARTKQEIQRDFEYLMRTWETVRELTLTSSAPALVYEEGSLIKRAIRDLYNKEIDEVVVAGEAGYREARDFMRLLAPSHVRHVHHHRDPQPIFAKWGAESQLDALFHSQVTLKSGGYLVINQTEALVAIDVNSGRSTREHNIEDTALRTNLEAADEVARQLRLRDLAGLIVVDFIDMEENRNNRAVEKRIKEALKNDRARIQVGRISHFGLLEMSRQRIRTGLLEGSSVVCPHCAGAGVVRSTASIAVHVMRVLEDALIKSASHNVILRTRTDISLYILNQKRALLRLIEERFGVSVTVEADDSLAGGAYHALERGEPAAGPGQDPMRRFDPRRPADDAEPIGDAEAEAEFEEEAEIEATEAEGDEHAEGDGRRRRRRRRGRGRSYDRDAAMAEPNAPQPSDEGLGTLAEIGGDLISQAAAGGEAEADAEGSPENARDERRRGRGRWRRRPRGKSGEAEEFAGDWRPSAEAVEGKGGEAQTPAAAAPAEEIAAGAEEFAPLPAWRAESPSEPAPEPESEPAPEAETVVVEAEAEQPPAEPEQVVEKEEPSPRQPELPVITEADPDKPKRSGWWARAKANLTGG